MKYLEDVKKEMQKHNQYLSKYACNDSDAIYLKSCEDDIRTSFFHDIDRIIYSLSFIRYQDKTQVFSNVKHDHIQRRMIHVILVSKIGRTIGRALGLNEDLIEAASLGHDLGHVPFGHVGESIINEISLNNNEGYFNHNIESVRVLKDLEKYGEGQNISVQVLDAIMCHNGEIVKSIYEPVSKNKEEFLEEYENSYKDKNVTLKMHPMTLEGCVVRVSDLIAYLGRDIDDGVRLNLIKREDIPSNIKKVLGSTTKEMVNTCIMDIINNSYGKNYIKFSDNIYEAIEELKRFNYEKIYLHSESSRNKKDLKEKFQMLFDSYLKDLESNNKNSPIINSYLDNMCLEYVKNNSKARIVIDYIAGMTDDYFMKEFERINNKNI